MQGLPSQLLSKSPKAVALGDKKLAANSSAEIDGKAGAVDGSEKASTEGFASLFGNMLGKEKSAEKASEVQSETGEVLKNLLAEKNKTTDEVKVMPNIDQAVIELNPETAKKTIEKSNNQVSEKITKTSSNLDQLLNNLKGTQDTRGYEENSEGIKRQDGIQSKKLNQQGELKTESPLDFLLKGAKSEGVTVTDKEVVPEELLETPKKVMTGEDYIKNMETSDKKTSLKSALPNGVAELQKNNSQNVKGYGQGLSLLSDPLIKNTKDLASKETKKSNSLAINELKSPDTKVGSELAAIKQDVIPGIQDNKNAHGSQPESKAEASQKVLDLSKINTANTAEIIRRISDYVEQNQVANKSSLDLTVKHDSLGEFNIHVTKMPNQPMGQAQNLIDMQITTSNKEGHDFFVKNEVSLMKNLSQAGVNISDLRIISNMSESTAFGQSDSKQSSSFSQNSDGTEKQFMSFESNNFGSDTSKGSQRRKELWEEYQQRYGA